MLRLIGIDPARSTTSAHTEEEIRILMKESHKSGLIDNTELTLVDNIFEFAETNAREIMIPRTEMNCLYMNLPFEENKAIALEEMHTRYPVCENDKDNIIGFVHIKDLLQGDGEGVREHPRHTAADHDRAGKMQISQLLKLMQKKKTQIAILIDEYGGTSGLGHAGGHHGGNRRAKFRTSSTRSGRTSSARTRRPTRSTGFCSSRK